MSDQQSIKEIIKGELVKCSYDPAYFIKKYVYISHPIKGTIPFNLYLFQEKTLEQFLKNKHKLILKSRQLGISTLTAAYALWLMVFHSDKNILVVCTTQGTSKNMVTKVTFAFDNLPGWMKEFCCGPKKKPLENNKTLLKLGTNSQIKAVSGAGDATRSEAVSLLIIDEAAFIDNMEEVWASAQSTISTGGESIILSTPNGSGNFFHKNWVKSETDTIPFFFPIKLPWQVHPDRDQTWRDEQDEVLGPRLAAQECDCDFSTSGETVIPPDIIKFYEETFMKDPVEKRGFDGNYWIWEMPDYSTNYMVIADVARGDGADYSTFHVIDIKECKQVAEYKGQLAPALFGDMLVSIGTEWNDALLIVENANIGWSTIERIIEREYKNLYYSVKDDIKLNGSLDMRDNSNSNSTAGFTTSVKTRPLLIAKLDEYMRQRALIIHSKRTIEEIKTFIYKNGRPEARSGYNDDLVMPLGIGMFVRDTAIRLNQVGLDLTKATLGGFRITNNTYSGIQSTKNFREDPFKMKLSDGNTFNLKDLL
jgi:hypothetical protein